MDLNPGPLVLDATALPTAPKPLPILYFTSFESLASGAVVSALAGELCDTGLSPDAQGTSVSAF